MSETADLFRAGLERLAAGDLGGYLDLCSEDVEFEFPFAPPGRPERVRGREDLRRYLEPLLATCDLRRDQQPGRVRDRRGRDHRRGNDDRPSDA